MAANRFADHVQEELPYHLTHLLVQELREGQAIHQCFLVKQKTQRSTRNGDPYLEVTLADRTGTLPARAWSDATHRYATQFDEGDFVHVEGRTETYRGSLQLIIKAIRRLESYEADGGKIPGFDPRLLVPATTQNVDEMWAALHGLAETIDPQQLRSLTLALLDANAEAFKESPAGTSVHHAYLGGLLEHTLEVSRGTAQFVENHPEIHRGLATAGAILHDIGKLQELENPIAPRYGTEGELIGHLLLGRDIVRDKAAGIDWPDSRLPILLEHILIAHHGELEYGSPILPKTPEAITVYYFDNLSAKLNSALTHIERDTEPGDFTSRHFYLNRQLFKGKLCEGANGA